MSKTWKKVPLTIKEGGVFALLGPRIVDAGFISDGSSSVIFDVESVCEFNDQFITVKTFFGASRVDQPNVVAKESIWTNTISKVLTHQQKARLEVFEASKVKRLTPEENRLSTNPAQRQIKLPPIPDEIRP
jgi:hypothetical protein